MSGYFATRHPHAPDPDRRRIRLSQRERDAREQDWQLRRMILPLF
ncbi:hypothetical protein [Microbacterium sp. bgisy203]